MAEKVRPSFDQHIEKKGESATYKKAREAYEGTVKALKGVDPAAADFGTLRDAKRKAGIALSEQRQKDEAVYYADEITENVDAINEMKAENAKAKPKD